jgi:dTDP-4-dehydrorhamnose 3,5-epimerase
MRIEALELEGAFYLEPDVYPDARGYFFEWFQKDRFEKETGIDFNIVQFNCSKSEKGVLRGLHYQLNPHAQAKLVSVSQGKIQDVIVDIRKESPSYGQHYSATLDSEKKNQLYVPKGFAHGFLVLSDFAEISYAIDSAYAPDFDCGIIYNDRILGIEWELDSPLISEKDKRLKTLEEAKNNF